MNTIKAIAAAFALAATIAAPAVSAQAATSSSASVSYADLNLSTEKGREVLDKRIVRAAEKICGPSSRNLGMSPAVKSCQQDTIVAAMKSRDLAVADYDAKRFAAADRKVIRLVAQ